MKIGNFNIGEIEDWLNKRNLEPSLSDEFVRKVYNEVQEQKYKLHLKENVKIRQKFYSIAYDFVRRDLLKIIYKRNNYAATNIAAGFVYAIGNPAWPEFVKIGSAIDVPTRLSSYQTGSPNRDYFLVDYYFSHDRLMAEKETHGLFNRKGEWCIATTQDIRKLFKIKKKENHVVVLAEKLYEVKNRIIEEKLIAEEEKIKRRKEKIRLKRQRKFDWPNLQDYPQ